MVTPDPLVADGSQSTYNGPPRQGPDQEITSNNFQKVHDTRVYQSSVIHNEEAA
jgi:hypothetical protein